MIIAFSYFTFICKHTIMQKYANLVGLLFCMGASITSCQAGTSDPKGPDLAVNMAVANVELYSIHSDLELWQMLREQDIDNDSVNGHIANSLLRHILVIQASNIDVDSIRGVPLETACLITTNQVRGILDLSNDHQATAVAIKYIERIEDDVLNRVSAIQKNMLGTGCSLSP